MTQYLTTSFFTLENFFTFYVWFCVGFTTALIFGWFAYGLYKVCQPTSKNPLGLIKPHAKMRCKNRKKKRFSTLKIWG
jgi:hypothetical protein